MITNTVTAIQQLSTGINVAYPFPNKIFAASDLAITAIDLAGTAHPFTFLSGSTFTGPVTASVTNIDVDTGCMVTLSAPLAVNWILDIRTNTAELQQTSIKNQGQFLPDLHEEAFDRLTREVQDLKRLTYTFGLHGPDTDIVPWNALPGAVGRALKTLGFDNTGQPIAFTEGETGSTGGLAVTDGTTLVPLVETLAFTGATVANTAANQATVTIVTGYPQTPAESAAGVVPTNLGYAPGNVLRYGADLSGVTDSTAAFQAAIDQAIQAAARAAVVYVAGGTYKLSGALSARLSQTLHIYGDGVGRTNINQTVDAHVFNLTVAANSGGRVYIHDLTLIAAVGTPMLVGRAISVAVEPYTTGVGNSLCLVVARVIITKKSTTNDQFLVGIWGSNCTQNVLRDIEMDGIGNGAPGSIGIYIEASTMASLLWMISYVMVYGYETGMKCNSAHQPGIESVYIVQSEFVGVVYGIVYAATLYAPPKLVLDSVHINSTDVCVDLNSCQQIFFKSCLFYRTVGAAPFVRLKGVTQFEIDLQANAIGTAACPIFQLIGTPIVGNGVLQGYWSNSGASTQPAIAPSGVIFNVRVDAMRPYGYTGFLPPWTAPGYTSGPIVCAQPDDNTFVTVTPTGTTPNLVIDVTYAQTEFVYINASAGTISSIVGVALGKKITLSAAGAVALAHTAQQIMPGAVPFVFGAANSSQLTMYRQFPTQLTSVGRL